MANANRPSGLSPIGHFTTANWNGRVTRYCIPSTDGNAFAIGDPVALAGSADAAGIPTITLATAGTGNVVLGAIVSMGGFLYGGPSVDPTNLNTIIIPATKAQAYYVEVTDDPSTLYEIQEIGTGTPLTAADVGTNANLVSGTNNGYVSGWMLNNSGNGTGSTIQLQILRAAQRLDNAIGQYCKWIVRINNHQFSAGQTGV
jgi:hypothetical protein